MAQNELDGYAELETALDELHALWTARAARAKRAEESYILKGDWDNANLQTGRHHAWEKAVRELEKARELK